VTALPPALLDRLSNAVEDAGLEWRDDYSGRCMFGETCVAVVAPSEGEAMGVVAEVLSDWDEDHGTSLLVPVLAATVEDSMGRDVVIYFPGFDAG
jgi:hypothetical protein